MRWLLLFSLLFLSACTRVPKQLAPSVQVLSTNKRPAELIPDLSASFTKNNYKVRKQNTKSGLLTINPRAFNVKTGSGILKARQIIQMRQEGGSLKLRLVYICKYKNEKYTRCTDAHPELLAKIGRLDAWVNKIVNAELIQEKQRAQSKDLGEINQE